MKIDNNISLKSIESKLENFLHITGDKIEGLINKWNPKDGMPVYTVNGKYVTRGWTEWTQGFMYGNAILQFDATDDDKFLELAQNNVLSYMNDYITHTGVHDHGFNNFSTYGNLRRLMLEGRIPKNEWQMRFYELNIRVSGVVQANRWTTLKDGTGF